MIISVQFSPDTLIVKKKKKKKRTHTRGCDFHATIGQPPSSITYAVSKCNIQPGSKCSSYLISKWVQILRKILQCAM